MMKLQTITLKDKKIVETAEGFEVQFENESIYPLYLTHAALKRGHELGIIEGSLITDFIRVASIAQRDLSQVDDYQLLSLVYLSFLGANPQTMLSFEEFAEKVHLTTYELAAIYMEEVMRVSASEENKFAQGFKQATAKAEKKSKAQKYKKKT